jgi:hypothetical protein
MKSAVRFIVTALFVTALGGRTQAVQVAAQVDTSRPIYANSPFAYSIIIADGSQPVNVDMGPLRSYNPSEPSTQNQTSIVNGRTSSYIILTYQLTAGAAGQYTLPAVTVTVSGKTYQTEPAAITVVEPGATQQMDVETEISTESCYVGQPVVLTFSFYVWTDIVRSEMIANINFLVPALDSYLFHVEETDDAAPGQQLAQLPVNGRAQPVLQDQVRRNGVDCVRVRFSKILIPRRAGDFTLRAGTASADLAVGQAPRRSRSMFDDFFSTSRYQYQRFSAESKPLSLKVQPLPADGRPADFYGLVGRYTISAEASPVNVNVGDPITLTVRVGGSRYLKPVQWPDLEKVEGFSDFRIPAERSDGEIAGGQKVFTQTVRAGSDSVQQIPPIPLSFFDSESGRYRTVYSNPIRLDVAATRMVTGDDIESAQPIAIRPQMQSIKEGLSANYTSADALVNQHFYLGSAVTGAAFWGLWAGPALLLGISVVSRKLTNQNPERMASRRRKNACSAALRRIGKVPLRSTQAGPELARILNQYIADKFGKVSGALTAEDGRRLIESSSGDAELAARFKAVTERAEAAAYSPTGFEYDGQAKKELTTLLREVDKKLK